MKRFFLFAVSMVSLIFMACHKELEDCPPDLPCATQAGENTFGCYVDGKAWVAKVEPFILDPSAHKLEVTYDETDYSTFNDNYFRLLGVYYGDTSTSLIIHFNPLLQTGDININLLNFYGISFRTPHAVYEIDKDSPYEVNITKLDLEKKIISGTFFFKAIYGLDAINITEGRFDVKYNPE